MHPQLVEQLKQHNIFVANGHAPRIHFGYAGGCATTRLEPFIELREGCYDIETIGAYSYMGGPGTIMRHISSIGRFCSIAANVITGQVEHPTHMLSTHPVFYADWLKSKNQDAPSFSLEHQDAIEQQRTLHKKTNAPLVLNELAQKFNKITIGNDVWIGYGAFIRRGVSIGDGAIIASHAVVTKNVPPYAIVAGTPAKIVRYRFDEQLRERLLCLQWWKYGLALFQTANIDHAQISLQSIITLEQTALHCQQWNPPAVRIAPPAHIEPA